MGIIFHKCSDLKEKTKVIVPEIAAETSLHVTSGNMMTYVSQLIS